MMELIDILSKKSYYIFFTTFYWNITNALTKVSLLIIGISAILSIGNIIARIIRACTFMRMLLGLALVILDLIFSLFLFIYPQLKVRKLMNAYKTSMAHLIQNIPENQIYEYLVSEKNVRKKLIVDIINS